MGKIEGTWFGFASTDRVCELDSVASNKLLGVWIFPVPAWAKQNTLVLYFNVGR